MWCRSRTLSLCVTALLTIVAATAAVPATTAVHDAGHWSWFAPADATGPGAFRATVDFGEDNQCEVHGEATGVLQNGPNAWIRVGGSWAMTSGGELAHFHDDALGLDTRGDGGGSFGLGATFGGTWDGVRDVTVLVTDMDGWLAGGEDPTFPAGIAIDCESPIDVLGFAGSHEVFAFAESGMSGGTGAHADALFAGAAVNMGDTASASLASDAVEVDIIDWVWSGPDVYEWTLTTPTDTVTASGVLEPVDDFHYAGGAGTYTFDLDRIAVGQVVQLSAWIAGFEPVADLDELV